MTIHVILKNGMVLHDVVAEEEDDINGSSYIFHDEYMTMFVIDPETIAGYAMS